jgi:hypothetical protein
MGNSDSAAPGYLQEMIRSWPVYTSELGTPGCLIVYFPDAGAVDGLIAHSSFMSRLDGIGICDVAVAIPEYDETFEQSDARGRRWKEVAPYRVTWGTDTEGFERAVERAKLTVKEAQRDYPGLLTFVWGHALGGAIAIEVAPDVEHCVGTLVWCARALKPPRVKLGLHVAHLNLNDPSLDATLAEQSLKGYKVFKHQRENHTGSTWWMWNYLVEFFDG